MDYYSICYPHGVDNMNKRYLLGKVFSRRDIMGFIIVILVATVLILLHQRSKSLGKTSFLSRLFEPMPIKSTHYEEKLSRKKLLSNRALKKLRRNIVDEGKYRKSFLAAPTQENKHPFTVKLIWDRTQLSYVKLLIWNLHDGILITSQVHLPPHNWSKCCHDWTQSV